MLADIVDIRSAWKLVITPQLFEFFKPSKLLGMDPKAVRPDRDSTQRANLGRPKKKAPEEEREVN